MDWFIEDLLQYNVAVSLRGQYSANILLDNRSYQHTRAREGEIVRIRNTVSGHDAYCFPSDDTCIFGRISGMEDSHDGVVPDKQAGYNISSIVGNLASRPINSQELTGYNINLAIKLLFTEYSGIPEAYFNFSLSETETLEKIVITGDNLIEEARQLVRAFGGELFVNRSGTLIAADWKDETSAVEYEIPDHMVMSVSSSGDVSFGASRIKVRGRYYSFAEDPGVDGAPDVGDVGGNQTPGGDGGGPEAHTIICSIAPVWMKNRELLAAVPAGDEKDLLGTKVLIGDEAASLGAIFGTEGFSQASLRVAIKNFIDEEGGFPGSIELFDEVPLTLKSRIVPEREKEPAGVKDHMRARPVDAANKIMEHVGRMFSVGLGGVEKIKMAGFDPLAFGGGGGGITFGGGGGGRIEGNEVGGRGNIVDRGVGLEGGAGAGGGGSEGSQAIEGGGDRSADEGDELRIECTLDDDDLREEYGVRIEEISNKYIKNSTLACSTAVRAFKEFKMRRRLWSIKTAFIPCLDVNMVVKVRIPHTSVFITGLLSDISLNVTVDPFDFDMNLIIESFEDLGV